jgi:hypothetical protein
VRQSDIWIFRIATAGVAFAIVFFGGRPLGQYLHVQEAEKIAHHERSLKDQKDDAKILANGYADTEGYHYLETELTLEERQAAFVKPHWIEEWRLKLAAGAAVIVAFMGGESARIWAAKREGQRRISGRYRPQ